MSQSPRKQKGSRHEYCEYSTVVHTPEIKETKKETATHTAFRHLHTLKHYSSYSGQQEQEVEDVEVGSTRGVGLRPVGPQPR